MMERLVDGIPRVATGIRSALGAARPEGAVWARGKVGDPGPSEVAIASQPGVPGVGSRLASGAGDGVEFGAVAKAFKVDPMGTGHRKREFEAFLQVLNDSADWHRAGLPRLVLATLEKRASRAKKGPKTN